MQSFGYPPDNACYFFQHSNYEGEWMSLSLDIEGGETEKVTHLKGGWWDNAIDSLVCGANILVYLCDHDPNDDCMNGHGFSLAGGYNRELGSSMTGHGNSATTVKMYHWEPVKGYGGVTAFQDRDCVDDSAYFPAGAPGEKMFFRYQDLKYHNFSKNELDNFMIPVGYEATIFYNDGFSGRSETLRGMEKDGRMVCQRVDMDNDTVSMTVMK